MFLSLIPLFLIALFLIHYSNNSTNKKVRWVGAIIPPLFMLLFVYIPIDLITSLFWLIAFVLLLYCTYRILIIIFFMVYAKVKSRELNVSAELFKLIRPSLYIFMLLLAQHIVHSSVTTANMAAIELAIKMKKQVEKNGYCERSIDGWKNAADMKTDTLKKMVGNFGTVYQIFYTCKKSSKEFDLWVRIDQDSSFSISYSKLGVLEATYGHFLRPTKVIIDESTNLTKLADMK